MAVRRAGRTAEERQDGGRMDGRALWKRRVANPDLVTLRFRESGELIIRVGMCQTDLQSAIPRMMVRSLAIFGCTGCPNRILHQTEKKSKMAELYVKSH